MFEKIKQANDPNCHLQDLTIEETVSGLNIKLYTII